MADGVLTVAVTVPPGATAELELPTADPNSVREGAEPVVGRPGVLQVVPSATGVTLRLVSGSYTVSATAPGAEASPVTE